MRIVGNASLCAVIAAAAMSSEAARLCVDELQPTKRCAIGNPDQCFRSKSSLRCCHVERCSWSDIHTASADRSGDTRELLLNARLRRSPHRRDSLGSCFWRVNEEHHHEPVVAVLAVPRALPDHLELLLQRAVRTCDRLVVLLS